MEQEKRGRGRPKIDTHLTEIGAPSRRQAINAMYMFEGVHLLSVAATDIPDSHLLRQSDDATMTTKSKNGILEQLGRMVVQDKYGQEDCVYIANLAINALKAGCTSRTIEKAIRNVRTSNKKASADPNNKWLNHLAIEAANELRNMGGVDE